MVGPRRRRYTEAGARRTGRTFPSQRTRETAMRTRIGAAAVVLVIGTAAWALAQREEPPAFRRDAAPPATTRVEGASEVDPVILPPPAILAAPGQTGPILPPETAPL